MIKPQKNISAYLDSILPKEYEEDDLFVLVDTTTSDILSTYANPYNFVRYYWRIQLQSQHLMNTYVDPVSWLYYHIESMGSDITKKQLERTLKAEDERKSLNDLSFTWLVEQSLLVGDVTFSYAKPTNPSHLANNLRQSDIIDVKKALESAIQFSNDRSIFKQSMWLKEMSAREKKKSGSSSSDSTQQG